MFSDTNRTGTIVNSLLVIGLGVVAVSVISYAVEQLRAMNAPWQAQLAVAGLILLFLGLASGKLYSK